MLRAVLDETFGGEIRAKEGDFRDRPPTRLGRLERYEKARA